jgi:hypothetical protein
MPGKLQKAKELKLGPDKPKERAPKDLTPKEKADWNAYVDYMESIKMRGNEALDKAGLGYNYFDEYIKNNPSTSLTRDKVFDIQSALLKHKEFIKQQIAKGIAAPPAGKTSEDIMSDLSRADWYPGSKTTKYKFPGETWKAKDKIGNIIDTKRVQFSDTKKDIAVPVGLGKNK